MEAELKIYSVEATCKHCGNECRHTKSGYYTTRKSCIKDFCRWVDCEGIEDRMIIL